MKQCYRMVYGRVNIQDRTVLEYRNTKLNR